MRCVNTKHGHMGSKHRQRRSKRRPWTPMECLYRVAGLFSLTLLASLGATPAAAATCASLAGLALPDTTITTAEPVAAGTYTAPDGEVFANLPAFCRIAATLTPTSDSNINIEVWMPYSGWNGRFPGTGNAGIAALSSGAPWRFSFRSTMPWRTPTWAPHRPRPKASAC